MIWPGELVRVTDLQIKTVMATKAIPTATVQIMLR